MLPLINNMVVIPQLACVLLSKLVLSCNGSHLQLITNDDSSCTDSETLLDSLGSRSEADLQRLNSQQRHCWLWRCFASCLTATQQQPTNCCNQDPAHARSFQNRHEHIIPCFLLHLCILEMILYTAFGLHSDLQRIPAPESLCSQTSGRWHSSRTAVALLCCGWLSRQADTCAGQGRAGQGRAGQGRAGQGRAGQGRAGQGRAGQGSCRKTFKLSSKRCSRTRKLQCVCHRQ